LQAERLEAVIDDLQALARDLRANPAPLEPAPTATLAARFPDDSAA
jgi:hypothetical protein